MQGGYYADITEEARCQVCNFVVVVAVLMSTKYKKHDRGGSLSGYISYLVLVLGVLMETPYTNSHKDIGLGKKYFSPVIFVPDVCIIFFPGRFSTSAPWPTPLEDCTPTPSSAPTALFSTNGISSVIGK